MRKILVDDRSRSFSCAAQGPDQCMGTAVIVRNKEKLKVAFEISEMLSLCQALLEIGLNLSFYPLS